MVGRRTAGGLSARDDPDARQNLEGAIDRRTMNDRARRLQQRHDLVGGDVLVSVCEHLDHGSTGIRHALAVRPQHGHSRVAGCLRGYEVQMRVRVHGLVRGRAARHRTIVARDRRGRRGAETGGEEPALVTCDIVALE